MAPECYVGPDTLTAVGGGQLVEMEEGEFVVEAEVAETALSYAGLDTSTNGKESDGMEITMAGEAAESNAGQVKNIHEKEPVATETVVISEGGRVDMENANGSTIVGIRDVDLPTDSAPMEDIAIGGGRKIVTTGEAELGADCGEMEYAQLGGRRAIDMVRVSYRGPDGAERENSEIGNRTGIAVTGDPQRENTEIENGTEIPVVRNADHLPDSGERDNTTPGDVPGALGDIQLQEGSKEDPAANEVCQKGEAAAGRVALTQGSLSAMALEGRGYVLVAESDSDSEEVNEDQEGVQMVGSLPCHLAASSSDDASSTSGSSSDEDEPVRVAVKMDSKVEGRKKSKGESSDDDGAEPPRTKNELAALPRIPDIDVVLQPHHVLQPFGSISSVLGKNLIVQSSGSICTVAHVLNEGSILWLTKDHIPLGFVDEVFGPVKTPFYLVRYNDEADIPEGAVEAAEVSVVPEFISYIVDKDPELYKKGYDASGCNDEELSDAEVEFSDDEKEAAYKRTAARKGTSLQGRNEIDPGNGVDDVPAFPPQQRDRSCRGGRGRGQQRGRSRFGDQHKVSQVSRGGSNHVADMAVKRIADMDIQLPSGLQPSPYNDRGRQSEGGSQKGNHSRPSLGWRKGRPRSDLSESEAMSSRTDASAGSACDEVFGNRSPFPERLRHQEQSPELALSTPGWGPGNPQGYRPPYPPGLNQCYRMQFPTQVRAPQSGSPVAQGGWDSPGMVNGQPAYQHPGYANFIQQQQQQQHGPAMAVGYTGFAPHPPYGISLGDHGFNTGMNGPLSGHPGPAAFYPANVTFAHMPHMLSQQNLNYVNPLGFVQQQPGNISQAGYSLNTPYSQGSLVYMDNGMRQPSPSTPGGFSPQLSQPGGIMFQQAPSPNLAAFHSGRSLMNGSFARRSGRPGQ